MALQPFNEGKAREAVERTGQAVNTLERILCEVSTYLPGTGASDVYAGAVRAARAAREKLQIEIANHLYAESHARD